MRLIPSVTAAGFIAATLIASTPAMADGCYVAIASNDMNDIIAGGASLQDAYQYAVSKGKLDGSNICWIKLKGWARRMKYTFPYLHHAIWSG